VVAIVLVALTLARPPGAYAVTGTKHVPLTISSWCWGARCSAPIPRAQRVIATQRGATVHVHLGFVPTGLTLSVDGARVGWRLSGTDLTWHAMRAGGLSLTATGVRGFVTYVGRVVFR
jgi:hypothetical protein